MELQHINVKLLVKDPDRADFSALIPVFHRWIQRQALEGQLLDVADYRHVPAGPGVILIGHDGDYSLDNTDHRVGVRYNRKATLEGSNNDRLRQAFFSAVNALLLLEQEPTLRDWVGFDGDEFEISINDRLLAPNSPETVAAISPGIEAFFNQLFGTNGYHMAFESDRRRLFTVFVRLSRPISLSELERNLSAASPAKSSKGTDAMTTLTESHKPTSLNNEEILRYSRHLIMPEVGKDGQERLKKAKVLCIGTGGLGSPVAMYLAAAGVGTLGLVDFDVVDFTNLQRQIIHFTSDVGTPKLQSAAAKIGAINPFVKVQTFETRLTSSNALEILNDFDFVIDGTDNFPTRFLVNDACALLGKPNVYGSVFRFEGQASIFYAKEGPCYRCVYPEPPPPGMVPSCAEGGVLGILPGLVGLLQASEAVKLIVGIGQPLIGRMLLLDVLAMRFREMKIKKNPDCPMCGPNRTIHKLIDYEEFCGMRGEEAPITVDVPEISVEELKRRLDAGESPLILDVREPHEYSICNLNGFLMPLETVAERLTELDRNREIIVHCRSGVRSAKAVTQMRKAGFTNAKNLAGGILAWADRIDPNVPKY
jgi:sulfur-carrier protein adenylyltransferase/sulfurtransferase